MTRSLFDPEPTARISECGRYRYALTRTWDDAPPVAFVMLNPSTATAETDDPTIRKCIGFAKRWGAGGIVVVNLYAYRTTYPRDLLGARDPKGPENDRAIVDYTEGLRVVAAWGRCDTRPRRFRAFEVRRMLADRDVVALRLTDGGDPWHPLYVPYDVEPVPFGEPPARREGEGEEGA